ncbi:MAG: tryptophan synthase subunit alpha, partial [Planctomycetaceae bacterium]|nr:tryptophan synthase subunit alpha [Planctomycetaceae bacterium]
MLSQVADGIIVGSAIVKRVASAAEIGKAAALENVRTFVQELVAEL